MKVFDDATLRGSPGNWVVERPAKKGQKPPKPVADAAIDPRLPRDRLDGCAVTLLTNDAGHPDSIRVVPRGELHFVAPTDPSDDDLVAPEPVVEPEGEVSPALPPGPEGSLLFVDVIGVQDYVFRSNRLRDVVGASRLVRLATKAASKAGARGRPGLLERALGDADAAVLSDAGGNAVLRLTGDGHDARARSIAARYSRLLLDEVPGLDVLVHLQAFASNRLAAGLQTGFSRVAAAKFERRTHSPLLGLGVTQVCSMTGLPATSQDADELPVSDRIRRTREAGKGTDAEGALDGDQRRSYALSNEFDELGRTRAERSLIGVVHVDGNAVGARITSWLDHAVGSDMPDERLVEEYRAWSGGLEELGERVRAEVLRAVMDAVESIDGVPHVVGTHSELDFPLRLDGERTILPVRPVLLGGDDLTFVCDGRIALALAATALRAFEQAPAVPHLGKVYAAAGVSIVQAHAPFARAYELSEDLTRSAKALTREQGGALSALDWHIGATRPQAAVDDIRDRQYQIRDRPYATTARPLLLDAEGVPSWRWLEEEVLDHEVHGLRSGAWADRRSKIKHLAGLASSGQLAVRHQLEAWRAVDEEAMANPVLAAKYQATHGMALVDAAELLDIHHPLRRGEPST